MISHSHAYVAWRTQSQQMLDFAVLVTTAAPQLGHALAAHAFDSSVHLVTNGAFRSSEEPYSTERRALKRYEQVLGATVLLSVFSYFETYFFSLVDEILAFHGGDEEITRAMGKQLATTRPTAGLQRSLCALRTRFKPNRADRYRKHAAALRSQPIMWPSQRFMLYGLKQAVANRPRWRSAQIPDLITTLLTFGLTGEERSRFHNLRDQRNQIAHGKSLNFDLRKAGDGSNFLRELAVRLDAHVVDAFFLIERYAH